MTNEEAITYIKQYCYGEWCEDEWREAMDMAIKALEQPEIIRCKDCEWGIQDDDATT